MKQEPDYEQMTREAVAYQRSRDLIVGGLVVVLVIVPIVLFSLIVIWAALVSSSSIIDFLWNVGPLAFILFIYFLALVWNKIFGT